MEKVVASAVEKIDELKSVLMDKAAELEEVHAIATEQQLKFEGEVTSLKQTVEELSQALSNANKAKEEAESELKSIKDDALLQQRIRSLHENKVLCASSDAAVRQAEKIKGLADAEFDVYLSELVDVRNQALGVSTAPVVVEDEQPKAEDDFSKTATEVIEAVSKIDASDDARVRIRQLIAELLPAEEKSEAVATEIISPEPNRESASCERTLTVDMMSKAFTSMMKLDLE
jgi:FtsZ-binding cell division protein ZapB